jgi:hypothetical protein
MSLKVYGASDDLIEIVGDVKEEFLTYYDDTEEDNPRRNLAFSDGSIFRVTYGIDGGFWRFTPIKKGTLYDHKDEATNDDGDDYSDILYFKDGIKWVLMGCDLAMEEK